MKCRNCGEEVRRIEPGEGYDLREYQWTHTAGGLLCDLDPPHAEPAEDEQITAECTLGGRARMASLSPGSCLVTSAVMILGPDGRKAPVTYAPDAEAASRGRTRFILSAPPGGGTVWSVEMLAEDGTVILTIPIMRCLSDGDTLLVPLELA